MKTKRRVARAISAFFLGAMMLPFSACNFFAPKSTDSDSSSSSANETLKTDVTGNGILHAVGEELRDEVGNTVVLRGVNAGGLFVTENWMNGFAESWSEESDIYVRDFKTISQVFIERFGEEEAQELWSAYRENWWIDADFANCAAMGMNVIRLPFTYMNVDFAAITDFADGYYVTERTYDFSDIDAFVEKAAEYGMYTILDLHGAYGSQSGKDHTGEVVNDEDVDFYYNEEKQQLTLNLWSALAEHYKGNPAVAGYDLLNEPAESRGSSTDVTSERHWVFLDKAYEAVREQDEEHVVIFESCWDGENLPHPSVYGWENCMYSFHHYSGKTDYAAHCTSMNAKITGVAAQNFGVPVYMGEFTCYENEESWDYTLSVMNRVGWSWTSWTYKLNNTWANSPWGIVTIPTRDGQQVNAHADSWDTILEKFALLKTTSKIQKCTFASGNTLEKIITEYCKQEVKDTPAAGSYIFFESETGAPLTFTDTEKIGDYVVAQMKGVDDGEEIKITAHPDGDKSVLLSVGGKNLGVYTYGGVYYVGVTEATGSTAKFLPMETEDGTAFISFTTCRYLYLDNGIVRADGTKEQASKFLCGHY